MEKEDRVRKLLSITAEHVTNVFRIIVTQAITQSQLTNSTIMWKYTCTNPSAIWDCLLLRWHDPKEKSRMTDGMFITLWNPRPPTSDQFTFDLP